MRLLAVAALLTLVHCAWGRPPLPVAATGLPLDEVHLGDGPSLLGFEVDGLQYGGDLNRTIIGGVRERQDEITGERVTRFRIMASGAPAWSVACRLRFLRDTGGPGIEQVCFLEPSAAGREPLRLVLAGPVDLPFEGALLRADEVLARVEGRPVRGGARPTTFGASLVDPADERVVAAVTLTGWADVAGFDPDVARDRREALAPALLTLAVARDPRNGLKEEVWRSASQPELEGGPHAPDPDRIIIPAFDPPPSSFGLEASASAGGSPAVAALAEAGRPALARALAEAEATQPDWLDASPDPAPLFGPDLRSGRRRWFVLADALLALTMAQPAGVSGGPRFGWNFALGLEMWDLVEAFAFLDLTHRHPLGDDTGLERRHVPRFGVGGRANLLRIDDTYRLFAGFEYGFAPGARLLEDDESRALWTGDAFGPLAGIRIRLGENLDGRSIDLRLEGALLRERWWLEESAIKGLTEGVERWTPSARTTLQLRL